MTFTITNPAVNNPAQVVSFVDNLPTKLQIAAVPNVQNTCTGGTITAVAGASSVTVANTTVGASTAVATSCTVKVDVTNVPLQVGTCPDANLTNGDIHIADLVSKLKASPQYKNMVIVITYDEFGGAWDHVAPPKGDKLGPGTRIPAIIISPYAKAGTVDHTQYDTASILRLITRTFGLDTLAGLKSRDAALTANGGSAMGDLTNALDLTK